MRRRIRRLAPDARLPVPTIGLAMSGGGGAAPAIQVDGTLAVSTDVGSYIASGISRINAVYIRCETPGTAGTTIVDIHLNGVTIFTVQASRPALVWNDPDGVAKSGVPDITVLAENDVLTVEIDQVATGAEDLVVVIDVDLVVGLVGLPGAAGPAGEPIFGSCYGNHIAWVQAAAVQNTWYNISDVDIEDGELSDVTHDGSGKLTVLEAGEYLVNWSLCYEDNQANDHVEVGIEVSGSGAAEVDGRAHSENKFANEEEHLSSCAILDLEANATLELAIRTTDVGNPTITVDGMNLAATRIGPAGGGVGNHNILDGTVHPDSVADVVTRGSIIVGNLTPKWDELPIGAPQDYLRSNAVDAAWSQIPAAEVVNTPAGDIAATDVQAAINELDTEKSPVGEGFYIAYIHLRDEKANNTLSGTFTQGAWRTRDLTIELSDTGGDAQLGVPGANQVTLEAGTYRCLISCPAAAVYSHKARLYNITDGATIIMGTSEYAHRTYLGQTRSFVVGRFTLASQKVLEVQHYCNTTRANDGFGFRCNFGVIEVYTEVELWKEA